MYEIIDGPAHRWAYLRAAGPRDLEVSLRTQMAGLVIAILVGLAGLTWCEGARHPDLPVTAVRCE